MERLVQAWRHGWEATSPVTRGLLAVIAAVFLAYAAFAVWFAVGFDF